MAFPLLIGGAPSRYRINQSLRFRASNSAHLTRTPGSTTNRRTFTWSGWVKRGAFPAAEAYLFMAGNSTGSDSGWTGLLFDASDRLYFTGSATGFRRSTARYRDPTAWYHIVCAVDTTNADAQSRVRLYVNNLEITAWDNNVTVPLNQDFAFNTISIVHALGRRQDTAGNYFDGYMAEVNFIDGQALTPSSFGQTDATTGAWVPRRYTGTYGTNGFYLPFDDATSTTTISQDRSGNGNNWTSSGISVTSGATLDQLIDSPTNGAAGTRPVGNYATLSPIRANSGILTSGNLDIPVIASSISNAATWTLTTGKWYFEVTSGTASGGYPLIGCYDAANAASFSNGPGQSGGSNGVSYWSNGTRAINGSSTLSWGATYAAGDVIGIAIDADSGRIWFAKNGTWQAVSAQTDPDNGLNPAATMTSGQYTPGGAAQAGTTSSFNFGQRAFTYTPPTGFVALCTANLPTPTIQRGDAAMDVALWAGNSAARTITLANSQLTPDLVWIKSRSIAYNNIIADSARGFTTGRKLATNTTDAEGAVANPDSDGYVSGAGAGSFNLSVSGGSAWSQTNVTGQNYVGWAWREGAAYGFDIVTYTGTGSARTVSHGLNAVPHMMIVKDRTTGVNNWAVYHRNASATPATVHLRLNQTTANTTDSTVWNDTAPTSSVFSVGTNGATNGNTNNFVAYLWTSIPGFSLFGSYTGNGSSDGPFVWCGFRPRVVLTKRVDVAENWGIVDAARSTFNLTDLGSYANLANAEASGFAMDFTANGFKLRSSVGVNNTSGGTYIFAAFAEHPFRNALAR